MHVRHGSLLLGVGWSPSASQLQPVVRGNFHEGSPPSSAPPSTWLAWGVTSGAIHHEASPVLRGGEKMLPPDGKSGEELVAGFGPLAVETMVAGASVGLELGCI